MAIERIPWRPMVDLRRGVRSVGPYAAQTAVLCVILYAALQLWRFDFHVQFNFLGDSLWFAVLTKSIVQNGWTFFVPQLSAPYGLPAAAFPAMTNFDWLVMRALAVFIADPAVVFNVFWLLTIVVTAWTCLFSLRILGVPTWLSALGGLIYTCLPFTWMRSTSHLSLVFYSVPLLCAFAVYLARGPVPPWTDATYRRAGLAGAIVQGLDYLYFSWFAILLFALAGVLGYAGQRRRDLVAWAGLAIGVIGIASVLNLAPSFYAWQKHGRPNLDYKTVAQAEIYGLKIRHLLRPHRDNPLPPLRWWAARDSLARFPNENENLSARLGVFGSLGFLLLLGVSLRGGGHSDADAETSRILAALNLAVLLITMLGGFGAIINTITVSDIRGYNRFSVFLAFFSIAGLSLWIAGCLRHASRTLRPAIVGLVVAVAGFSLYDQVLDAQAITSLYDRDKRIAADVDAVVGRMPTVFGEKTAVFQYPITDFPADFNRGRMLVYDHSLPYLRSDHFRWSWPSLTPRQIAWSRFISSLRDGKAVRALAAAGFDAVWIDRYGYRDDGAAIAASVTSGGGVEVLAGTSSRYAVFDIRGGAPR